MKVIYLSQALTLAAVFVESWDNQIFQTAVFATSLDNQILQTFTLHSSVFLAHGGDNSFCFAFIFNVTTIHFIFSVKNIHFIFKVNVGIFISLSPSVKFTLGVVLT